MTNLYTIGQVARFMNVSPKILRHYDHLGLLKPSYVCPESKYRYFSYDQFFIIDIIRYLNKTLLISLDEIKELIHDDKEFNKLIEILDNHSNSLARQIEDLKYSKKLTDNLIADIKTKKNHPKKPRIYEAYLMSRNLYYKKLDVSIYEIDKYANRNFKNMLGKANKDNMMCLLFSLDEYKKTKELRVKGFGIFSDEEIEGLEKKTLREGRYLINRFLFSEDRLCENLAETIRIGDEKQLNLSDTAILVSKMVDLNVSSKYDYLMDLQFMSKV